MGKLIKSLKFGPNSEIYDVGVTTKPIKVTGISIFGGLQEGEEIPAGTSMDDLVTKLIQKEYYPTPIIVNYSYKGNVGLFPTISLAISNDDSKYSKSINPGSGTKVYAPIGSDLTQIINQMTENNWKFDKQKNAIEGLEFGYTDNPGTKYSEQIYTNDSNDSVEPSDVGPKLRVTMGQFEYDINGTQHWDISSQTLISGNTIGEDSGFGNNIVPFVQKGPLNVSITVTPPQQKGYVKGLSSVYIISNLGNINDNNKTSSISDVGSPQNKQYLGATPSTVSYTIYGTYYKKTGIVNTLPDYDSIKNALIGDTCLIKHDFSKPYSYTEPDFNLAPMQYYYMFLPNDFTVSGKTFNGLANLKIEKMYNEEDDLIDISGVKYNFFYFLNESTGVATVNNLTFYKN